jgi:hypothetical protein
MVGVYSTACYAHMDYKAIYATADGIGTMQERKQVLDRRVGSDTALGPCPLNVSGLPESGRSRHRYSITSSARARNVGGRSTPRALAVVRLITS